MIDIRIRPVRHDTPQELAAPLFKARTRTLFDSALAAISRSDYAEVAAVLEHETMPVLPFGRRARPEQNSAILYSLTARFAADVRLFRLAAIMGLVAWEENEDDARCKVVKTFERVTAVDLWHMTEASDTKRRARLVLVLCGEIPFDHLQTRHERAAFALRSLVHRQYGRLQ